MSTLLKHSLLYNSKISSSFEKLLLTSCRIFKTSCEKPNGSVSERGGGLRLDRCNIQRMIRTSELIFITASFAPAEVTLCMSAAHLLFSACS